MKLQLPLTYQQLLQQAAGLHDTTKPDVETLARGFVGDTFSLMADAPIFYAVDYTKHKYLYIDPCFTTVLGYDIDFIKEQGPRYFTGLWHEHDFKIFNEHIFPETILFLKDQNRVESGCFSVSFNFRISNLDGHYHTMLQRSTYYIDKENGTPLAAVGFLVDISHYKVDTRIIHTIERIDRSFSTLNKIPVFKKIYYPDAVNNLLTKREIEILKCIMRGLKSKEIADELFTSIHTIHNHRKKIFLKTGASTVGELIKIASINGVYN